MPCRFVHFDLLAHLLYRGGKGINLLLHLRDCCFLFLINAESEHLWRKHNTFLSLKSLRNPQKLRSKGCAQFVTELRQKTGLGFVPPVGRPIFVAVIRPQRRPIASLNDLRSFPVLPNTVRLSQR